MPVFEYEVVDRSGAIGRGRQQAEDQAELMQRLRDRGQLVVSLRAADAPRAAPLRQALQHSFRRVTGRVRLATLVLFTGQLAAMLEAGLHLVRILTALARESSDRRFAKIVEDIRDSLSAATSQLPAATRLLLGLSRLVRESAVVTALGIGIVVAAAVWAARTERGRDLLDTLKLRIPVFGPLIRKAVLARTCRTMSLLLQSGLPLLDVLDIATHVAGNRTIERALLVVSRGVRDGGTLADMMQQTGAFTSLVTQLVATGEESGSLAAMLGKAAVYYEAQVDAAVAMLSTLVEPIMILVLGGIAGSVIFALYMPIFSLGQAMKGMK